MRTTIPYVSGPRTYVIEVDTKILNQMKMVEEWRGFMLALTQLGHVKATGTQRQVLDEALANVRIKGASISTQRALEIVERDEDPQTKSEREFINYFRLLEDLDSLKGEPGKRKQAILESDVRQCQARIVNGTMGNPAYIGSYRDGPVEIAWINEDGSKRVLHHPPDALEVPELMRTFTEWIAVVNGTGKQRLNALITAALAHYELVRIHPFVDGNGRTARLLATLVLLQHGYDFRQLFCITEYYDSNRAAYTAALGSVDQPQVRYHAAAVPTPDGEPRVTVTEEAVYDATEWIRHFCGGLAKQMRVCRHRIDQAMKADGAGGPGA